MPPGEVKSSVGKFKLKRELKELVFDIQHANKGLFLSAALRYQRGPGDAFDFPTNITQSGRTTSAVSSSFNYENDNFFETEDDRLIVTKKVQDFHHFWERIDAFFKVNIPKELF